ncbi:unnamed protein product [Microthlaspi erraticum]|uniref:NYN domain-containing protein n=1 Tax=Microthlaspi erraticum TaxID=1685480 RepID=A0A6D2ICQ8_9BRAS|nr:unnamed protein product [Microthlaspi erraticum]
MSEMMNTGVWWDMDTCPFPKGFDRYQVRQSIESALENHLPLTSSAIGDVPFTMSAIGDLSRIPEADLEAILSTGFFTKHVTDGSSTSVLMRDMYAWAQNHPPPARVILISDHEDDDFVESRFFESLIAAEYEIIRAYRKLPLVSPNYASSTLTWDDSLLSSVFSSLALK